MSLSSSFSRRLVQAFPSRSRPGHAHAHVRHASTIPEPTVKRMNNWAWRTVFKNPATGEEVQERTVYARPSTFNAKMLWFVIAGWGPLCAITIDNIRYSYYHPYKTLEKPGTSTDAPSDASAIASTSQKSTDSDEEEQKQDEELTFWDMVKYTSAIAVFGFGMVGFAMYYPTRIITRITQVRRTPGGALELGAQAKKQTKIRVETAAMKMWPKSIRWGRARELDKDELKVEMIRQGQVDSPYLKLYINPKGPKRILPSLDDSSYRLAFHKIQPGDYGIGGGNDKKQEQKKQEDVEIVVSLNRLEEALGKIHRAERNLK